MRTLPPPAERMVRSCAKLRMRIGWAAARKGADAAKCGSKGGRNAVARSYPNVGRTQSGRKR
jgi:hypothetical protein